MVSSIINSKESKNIHDKRKIEVILKVNTNNNPVEGQCKCNDKACRFCYDNTDKISIVKFFKKKFLQCRSFTEFNILMTNVIKLNNPSPLYDFKTSYNTDNWWWGHTRAWQLLLRINELGLITLDTLEGEADEKPKSYSHTVLNGLLPRSRFNKLIQKIPDDIWLYECDNNIHMEKRYNLIINSELIPTSNTTSLVLLNNGKILSDNIPKEYLNKSFIKYLTEKVVEFMLISHHNDKPATYLYQQIVDIMNNLN